MLLFMLKVETMIDLTVVYPNSGLNQNRDERGERILSCPIDTVVI
jgi:hypothetical protein